MKYSLKDLNDMLPPPSDPVEVPSGGDWRGCEAEFADLPRDFKEFLNCYGSGDICDVADGVYNMLVVFSPFAEDEYTNMIKNCENLGLAVKERRAWGDDMPHPRVAYPDKGGYLPVALTANGSDVYWETKGKSSAWKIASVDETELRESRVGWIDYLVMSLKGEIVSDLSVLMEPGTKLRYETRRG